MYIAVTRRDKETTALGPFFRDGLCFFYLFLLAFYFRILILYTTGFDPRINIIILLLYKILLLYWPGYIKIQNILFSCWFL